MPGEDENEGLKRAMTEVRCGFHVIILDYNANSLPTTHLTDSLFLFYRF